jgi:hypothetical protein
MIIISEFTLLFDLLCPNPRSIMMLYKLLSSGVL